MDRRASRQAALPGLVGSQPGASSVNLFHGAVTFPLTLVELPGRNSLNVVVSAIYSSNVQREVNTWNQDAPTGVLGVGWHLPFQRIVIAGQQAGGNRTAGFSLVAEGVATRLDLLGETRGVARFQLRTSPCWTIEYFRDGQYWVITDEDGTRSIYGRSSATASDGVQSGVRWGNWIGSSTQSQAQLFPLAWNLVRTENHYGDCLLFHYEQTYVPLGRSGVSYTQSCRLARIVDTCDRQVILTYKEKDPCEIQLPRIPPRPGDASAYQLLYETRYLDSIEVINDQGQPLLTTRLAYTLHTAGQSARAGSDAYRKRYLSGVQRIIARDAALPPVQFSYASGPDEANRGALQMVIYPEGGTVAYAYQVQYLTGPGTRAQIDAPGVGYVPRVWHGADFVVVTWYHAQLQHLVCNVYTWDGRWENWEARISGGFKLADLQVLPSESFFAVAYKEALTGPSRLKLYHKHPYRCGQWDEHDVALGSDVTSLNLAVGRDFVAVHSPTNQCLRIEQWDGCSRTWQRSTLETQGARQSALRLQR